MQDHLWLAGLALAMAATGTISATLAGLLGVGGGIVIVPVLFNVFPLFGIPEAIQMKLAVGTSLATIVPTSIVSARKHRAKGAMDMDLLRSIWPSMAAGVVLGTLLAVHVRGEGLSRRPGRADRAGGPPALRAAGGDGGAARVPYLGEVVGPFDWGGGPAASCRCPPAVAWEGMPAPLKSRGASRSGGPMPSKTAEKKPKKEQPKTGGGGKANALQKALQPMSWPRWSAVRRPCPGARR